MQKENVKAGHEQQRNFARQTVNRQIIKGQNAHEKLKVKQTKEKNTEKPTS